MGGEPRDVEVKGALHERMVGAERVAFAGLSAPGMESEAPAPAPASLVVDEVLPQRSLTTGRKPCA